MIRIHVLLLASLLSIWGLTSCENSDTDKVNSYNLEVNLSQNEITAINGIISIKVSIKEFDQLAYLVINKINDTNNISEKYIKSNLSPEYIFEYIIKKDDSSTFYFEFIAVDNNNQIWNIRNWAGWITNFSSLYKSSDNGITWTRCQNVKFGSTSNFGQVSYFKKDGYIYMVGTITGRDNKPHLARFLEENIENQTEYEFWNGSGWIKGNETAATPLFNDISGELSIAYHPEFKKWILLYFNSTRYDISFRTADHIIGEWSKPQKLVDGWQYSQLYGSYIHPISLKGNILYFIMSMWLPYNTYLMSAELKCNP